MEKIKEKTLVDALSYCDLRELPKEWDKETVYIRAIALVSKTDGSYNYAVVKKGDGGKDNVEKDFGNISAIRTIEKVYPFRFLATNFVPTFKTKSKDERLNWLEKFGDGKDYSSMTLKELDKEILSSAMQRALKLEYV